MTKPKARINLPKIMTLVTWGVVGHALVEILPRNPGVSAKYWCEFTIPHREANLKVHRPKHGLKRINFQWDNAPNHTANVTIVKISELGMK
jgi:hypothetical protein